MKTIEVSKILTEIKKADKTSLKYAADLLNSGEIVAIPTETVYGLAANIYDDEAVKKIFLAKGRPSDNPLIVHISDFSMVNDLAFEFEPKAKLLAEAFWPGPLTIVIKKTKAVSNLVSGGLDTVGIRIPESKITRDIIRLANVPVCAPSANLSGTPSPTSAQHVFDDLNGRIPLIIDGGNCDVGIESTVVSVLNNCVTLLRPGGITPEQLSNVVGEIIIDKNVISKPDENLIPLSPGVKYKHYSPKAKIVLIKSSLEKFNQFILTKENPFALVFDNEKVECDSLSYGDINDSLSQARLLFQRLREVDKLYIKTVYVRCPNTDGIGLGIYNRLIRAANYEEISLWNQL